ncbi:MAG: hypothetical protein WD875_16725 [Pirellulales bacterium]
MTTDEYVTQVVQIVQECFRSTDSTGSMPVASLAYMVRQRLGVDQTSAGFAKFKDVLGVLEERGVVKVGHNEKNAFAVWLMNAVTPLASITSGTNRFRTLRSPVWHAFVSEFPTGRRFLNGDTGDVKVGQIDEPSGNWIEIIPVNPQSEKEKAGQFLAENWLGDNEEIRDSISSSKWYVAFPNSLANADPQLAAKWKTQRSQRVISVVDAWVAEHRLNDRLVFETRSQPVIASTNTRAEVNIRRALLSAIDRMPTEQLLEIRIPSRLLIEAICPKLLDK